MIVWLEFLFLVFWRNISVHSPHRRPMLSVLVKVQFWLPFGRLTVLAWGKRPKEGRDKKKKIWTVNPQILNLRCHVRGTFSLIFGFTLAILPIFVSNLNRSMYFDAYRMLLLLLVRWLFLAVGGFGETSGRQESWDARKLVGLLLVPLFHGHELCLLAGHIERSGSLVQL